MIRRNNQLQDIFEIYGDEYLKNHKLPSYIKKVISDIKFCRTANLGGHIEQCDECGDVKISYNSCRNRHCPKCQTLAKEKWIYNQEKNLLPVGYFHIVFTLPNEFNTLILLNQDIMYNLLFKSVSETLLELAKDKKYLDAEIGITTILHTWGQNLMYHPHIHCIVPSGGLSNLGNKWNDSKKDFFIPVKVLSRVFRGKFLVYFKEAFKMQEFVLNKDTLKFTNSQSYKNFLNKMYATEWVVYAKAPYKSASHVLKYLGRYTHRVAISNDRILDINDNKITFKWRDYRDNNKQKIMTLSSDEFIRRFITHILPPSFVKIRHYGLNSNRNINTKLKRCKILLKVYKQGEDKKMLSAAELFLKITGINICQCKNCNNGNYIRKNKIEPRSTSPPLIKGAIK